MDMAHYLCPNCQDVVDFDGLARVEPADTQEQAPPALA
jgi:hypothetical protein